MARAFETVIDAWVADLTGPALQAHHVRVAKAALAQHSKEMPGAEVTTYVDGRKGAKEEQVKVGGVIRYEFEDMLPVLRYGLDECRKQSPVDSGQYRKSWSVWENGVLVPDISKVTGRNAVYITNVVPYHRKLEMTSNQNGSSRKIKLRLTPGITDRVARQIMRKFPGVVAKGAMVMLPGGYVLKGATKTKAAVRDRRSAAFRAGRSHLMQRKGQRAGDQMTYPAIKILFER